MGILLAVVVGTTTRPLGVYLSLSSYSVLHYSGVYLFTLTRVITVGAKQSEAKKTDAKRLRGAETFIDLALFVSGSYVQIQALSRNREKSTGLADMPRPSLMNVGASTTLK